jgi:hypothetical protein
MARVERITDRGNAFPAAGADRPLCRRLLLSGKALIIELDGGHHNEDATAERDSKRQAWLEQEGYRVIRFWNSDVTADLNAVLERIYMEVHGSLDAEALPLKHHRRR